ncbi:MAG: hypothetical protein WDZ88_04000 [Candidatus Paceibacterota bacterium]
MKDVSIEYAHIYTNSKIGEEHELSLKQLKDVYESNKSLVVMVDDYSFPDPTFDYDSFTAWLAEQGYKPAVVIRESQLIPQCDQVLGLMAESKLKEEIIDYIKSKKYPCSLFVATWYLLRFGKLAHPGFPESEYSERLINILPESFKPFEEKGFEIIRSTQYVELVDKIENRYIAGRLIT